jgi:hypothetical protein
LTLGDIIAAKARVSEVEVKHQVITAVPIHICHMTFCLAPSISMYLRGLGTGFAEADASSVNGGGVKGISRQDGHWEVLCSIPAGPGIRIAAWYDVNVNT